MHALTSLLAVPLLALAPPAAAQTTAAADGLVIRFCPEAVAPLADGPRLLQSGDIVVAD